MNDKADDDFYGHGEWLAKLAKDCRCCSGCNDAPCGGCQQGAPCDAVPCECQLEGAES